MTPSGIHLPSRVNPLTGATGTIIAPQPIVHRTSCYVVRNRPGEILHPSEGVQRYPYAKTHSCYVEFQVDPVRVVPVDYEPHRYEESMIWPGGAATALCRVCHGTF